MTHATYTHPGTNAIMLALSRATRDVVLCRRAMNAWQHSRDMYMVCLEAMWLAQRRQTDCYLALLTINGGK